MRSPTPGPRLSVILPVYNGARFLRAAVESIRRQRYEPLETIVVDDGSTDETREVATSFASEVSYVHQANAGPAAARNTGLHRALGTLIGFLDADDVWTDEKLALQVPRLLAEPSVDGVLGYTRVVYAAQDGGPGPPTSPPPGPVLVLGAALFRRSVFERVGAFDESLRMGEDVDWFLRAKERGLSLRLHPEVVHLYRRHDRNLTSREDLDRAMATMLKRSLDRRRQVGGGTVEPLPPWLGPRPGGHATPPSPPGGPGGSVSWTLPPGGPSGDGGAGEPD